MDISSEINNEVVKVITKMLKENLTYLSCPHKWSKHGHGFKCDICTYYTGTNENINALIRQLP